MLQDINVTVGAAMVAGCWLTYVRVACTCVHTVEPFHSYVANRGREHVKSGMRGWGLKHASSLMVA